MKRVADASKPPVVVPVIVIAIAVHVALVVPPVEREVPAYGEPSLPLSFEYSRGCI